MTSPENYVGTTTLAGKIGYLPETAMVPRTVQMAKEVANLLTSTQLENYGNIILNGYATTEPNTAGKLAWQYKETTTAPVPLPNVVSVQPALRGWTTNYYEYYTKLQPNGYGVNPGDPTMFEYQVHSYAPETGSISTIGWISIGSGYTLGTYSNVSLTGGSGSGATADIVVTPTPGVVGGPVTGITLTDGGSGYGSSVLFVNTPTGTVTGVGVGLRLDGGTDFAGSVNFVSISPGQAGAGYQTGDVVSVQGGNARVTVTSVSITGSVTGFTLVNPGTGYIAGEALSAAIPGGSGFAAPIATLNPTSGTGGNPRWAQAPRRFFQTQVSDGTGSPADNNSEAIQYSFIYPVADNPAPPPVDTL
jgi:hypothetical protein